MASYNCVLKLLLVGNRGVGKSSVAVRYTEGVEYNHTMEQLSVHSKTEKIGGISVKLKIWDSVPRARSTSTPTERSVEPMHMVVVCYDITDGESYDAVKDWVANAPKYGGKGTKTGLLGLKLDLERERQVHAEEARLWAERRRMPWMECSGRTGDYVEEAMLAMIDHYGSFPESPLYGRNVWKGKQKAIETLFLLHCCGEGPVASLPADLFHCVLEMAFGTHLLRILSANGAPSASHKKGGCVVT